MTTLKQVNEHLAKIDEADSAVEDAEIEVQEAESFANEVRRKITDGDQALNAASLVETAASIEFARLRYHGKVREAYDLRRAAPFIPIVAEKVAEALNEIVKYDVKAVEKIPAKPADIAKPTLYVLQQKGAVNLGGRDNTVSLKARLVFELHAPEWAAIGVSERKVSNLLEQTGVARSNSSMNALERQSVSVDVIARVARDDLKTAHLAVEITKDHKPEPTELVFDIEGDNAKAIKDVKGYLQGQMNYGPLSRVGE